MTATTTEHDRLVEGLRNADFEDIIAIVAAAIRLEKAMYRQENTVSYLFRLRKAAEGIWGHDLPRVDEWGNNLSEGDE